MIFRGRLPEKRGRDRNRDPGTLKALPILLAVLLVAACRPAEHDAARDSGPDELFAAARAGDLEGVRRLLDSGVAVDAVDRYDATALGMAAGAGHLEVVTHLLERGADPDHREKFFNASPLDQALNGEHIDVAIALLGGGADDRESALEYAASEGLADLAQAAVDSGPIHETRLEALRARSDIDPSVRDALNTALSRPDPPPPVYSAEDLGRFGGLFEGFSTDTLVDVTVLESGLGLSVGGAEPVALTAVAERTFRSTDGSLEASFWGRAGTIEMVELRRDGEQPESLRRSVAEPVGPEAYDPEPEDVEPAAGVTTRNWPGFRGPAASGVGDGVDTPATWDVRRRSNVRWRAELPGLGNSSPIVWDDLVIVTTAVAEGVAQEIRTGLTGEGTPVDEEVEHSWRVLAFDKRTGNPRWATEVGRGVPLSRRHFKASQANSTPVTDGKLVVAAFPTAGIACLDLTGQMKWKHDLGGLNAGAPQDPGAEWGFSSSPVLYGDQVILQVDVHEGPYVAAWDLWSGRELWRTARDVVPSWATPNILRSSGGDELVLNGSTIHGYDPLTGEELWSLGPNSELAIATPVVDDQVVYVTAGYAPVKPIYAVRAGARGALGVGPGEDHDRIVWSEERGGAYMPTPLLYRGILYVVHHNGRIVAYDAGSGAPIYKQRFSRGGTFTGSPVAVNGKLYVPTEEGLIYVIEAGPVYREIAVNEIGEAVMATPAVSEGILLIRTPSTLWAIADPSTPR